MIDTTFTNYRCTPMTWPVVSMPCEGSNVFQGRLSWRDLTTKTQWKHLLRIEEEDINEVYGYINFLYTIF